MAQGFTSIRSSCLWTRWSRSLEFLCLEGENHRQELLVVDCDDSVLVGVVLAERRGKSVEQNAALNEVIEQDRSLPNAVELSHQQLDQPVAESVTERSQCSFQLILVDGSTIVLVKAAEATLPIGDVLPQRTEI